MTYAEYHRMMGAWFATGRVEGRVVRQVAHELRLQGYVSVRVYWLDVTSREYDVPMTTEGGVQWTTKSEHSG